MNIKPHDIARVLLEALPEMQKYDRKIVVVKYGGDTMGKADLARDFTRDIARDIVLIEQLGVRPVVIHGGGPQINDMLDRLDIKSKFVDGLRVTDEASLEIVEMVLAGSINKQIVDFITKAGGRAVGLTGKDGNMVVARKAHRSVELGFVGEPERVDRKLLDAMFEADMIPVLAPIASGADGITYNVNGDTFAGAVAGTLRAKRLLFLTNVEGVKDKSGKVITEMSADDARRLIADGTITGGMIPKVETCLYALEAGVESVVIVDGREPHAVLLELFTEHGAGTLIRL